MNWHYIQKDQYMYFYILEVALCYRKLKANFMKLIQISVLIHLSFLARVGMSKHEILF